MATQRQPILFALDEDGEVKHIDEVARGEKCKCIACGERLIAKKGDRRLKIYHFAHASGVECEYGYESSLHLAAKNILETAKKIVIPSVYIRFPNSQKKPILFRDSQEIPIDSIGLEVNLRSIVPDIVIKSGKKILIIEIYVTHAVDKEKLEKIKEKNISAIEIDLSALDRNISKDELSHILLEDVQKKHWIYNAKETDLRKKFFDKSQKYVVTSIPGSLLGSSAEIVFDCPVPTRKLNGRMCADYWFDCKRCPFFIGALNNKDDVIHVQCTGAECISDCDDFSMDKEERIRKNNGNMTFPFFERYKETTQSLDENDVGVCPNCGYALREMNGRFGKFWGCYMFPHCKFTIWYDPAKGEYRYKND